MSKELTARKEVKETNVEFKVKEDGKEIIRTKEFIISEIENKISYVTNVNGKNADVEVKNTGKEANAKYLYSLADGTTGNNVDKLPLF